MAVVCRPQAAEQVSHRHTSRLPEAENEVAEEECDKQAKQDFPDVLQYFHGFSFLLVDFRLFDGLFFDFLLTFSGVWGIL